MAEPRPRRVIYRFRLDHALRNEAQARANAAGVSLEVWITDLILTEIDQTDAASMSAHRHDTFRRIRIGMAGPLT